jgi:hypothetical protein
MKYIFPLLLFFLSSISNAEERVYRLNRPAAAVWKSLQSYADIGMKEMLERMPDGDIYITSAGYIKRGYYKTTVRLISPANGMDKFEKTIEIWERGNYTTVRSRLEIKLEEKEMQFMNKLRNKFMYNKIDEILSTEKEHLESEPSHEKRYEGSDNRKATNTEVKVQVNPKREEG